MGCFLAVDANVAECRRGVHVLAVSLAGRVQRFVDDQAKFGVVEVPCGLDEDALPVLAGGTRDNLEVRGERRSSAMAWGIEGFGRIRDGRAWAVGPGLDGKDGEFSHGMAGDRYWYTPVARDGLAATRSGIVTEIEREEVVRNVGIRLDCGGVAQ